MSIGNAMGSVGGDFSSLSINPAGIGIYRRGEFVFSPSFNVMTNNSTYLGNTINTSSTKLNFSQFGLVLTSVKKGNAYKKSAWKAGSFAFGMNRNETYKNEYVYSGNNQKSSLIEKYAEEFNALGGINAVGSVSYPAYAAYQTWLIDRGFGADSNQAVAYVPYADGIRQTKRVYETGGMQEYVISAGGNYQEKLMIGATLGIPRVVYNRTLQFDEEDISGDKNNDFKYMYFTEKLSTTGTGINLKLGAIFKPVNNFRFGVWHFIPLPIYSLMIFRTLKWKHILIAYCKTLCHPIHKIPHCHLIMDKPLPTKHWSVPRHCLTNMVLLQPISNMSIMPV
ncbi:MAG: hypothetical protein V9F00_09770 [Nocardioides sp.]